MSDPYKVLGVSRDAGDEEVKAAYRELARKYHPDNYNGNPLSDLATEKMQEINEAYDVIMLERRGGGSRQASSGGGRSSQFHDIRRLINARRVTEAEELLNGVPAYNRDAEWFFLKGSVQYLRGWLDEAYENFRHAVRLDADSSEYRAALNQLEMQRRTGMPYSGGYRTGPATTSGCSGCDVCSTLICADCCCECMGGDLIRCC